jgi:hypothetical protein
LFIKNFFTDSSKDVFVGSFESPFSFIRTQYKIGLQVSESVLNSTVVKNLIKSKDQSFDVVIADNSNIDSMFMFAYKFGCPLVTVGNYR